ncbi:MAG: hypothetical protein IT378_03220 [Sandaracinaceae bacterium]|nr:hypothetical protein [Sandaracinaceae bacterium]
MRRLAPLIAMILATGCFSLDRDGDGMIDVRPPLGYEVDELGCSDGRDNDLDNRVDCQDEDCLMRGHCGEQVPLAPIFEHEDVAPLCIDGVDNDDDGQFDCGDPGCQDIRELCCLAEFDDATCSDGFDNDGNGFADCADFSCRNGTFVTVCGRERSCTNRIDDDGDRDTDCNDSDCACTEECRPGCAGPETSLDRCRDGFDNDGNGFTDCRDFSCTNAARGASPEAIAYCMSLAGMMENTLALCMDRIDNDANGFTDCGDRQCYDDRGFPPTGAAVDYCRTVIENTVERCSDGLDNDGNGYIDCEDNSCTRTDDAALLRLCEADFVSCTNRRDDEHDGYADCGDYSCRDAAAESVCVDDATHLAIGPCTAGACPMGQTCLPRKPCLEGVAGDRVATLAQCTDGFDNDGDGFADCDDWDCSHNPALSDGPCRDGVGRPLVCP